MHDNRVDTAAKQRSNTMPPFGVPQQESDAFNEALAASVVACSVAVWIRLAKSPNAAHRGQSLLG
jgi:hypothetical protein